MLGNIGSRYAGYRNILVALLLLLLVALSVAIILPGCGGKNAVVETEEREEDTVEDTVPEDEVEEEDEDTSDSQEEENGESVELDWEYTNELFGFSISYPDGWECVDVENDNGCSISDPDNDLFLSIAWALLAGEKAAGDWLDHLFDTVNANYGVTGKWVIERDPSNNVSGTFDGADYVYEFWTYEASGTDYYYDVMVMVEGGEVFFITAQYPVDQVEEIGPIVEAIMDSFTLPTR